MIRLQNYTLIQPIGRGGMGEVWLAEHRDSGKQLAIKVLTSARARDERYQRAFSRETRAIAALDHPHIVAVHDYGLIPEEAAKHARGRLIAGTPYLVMEYVAGGTLDAWRQKLSWGQLRAVLLSLLDALAHAHARQVIHRDLKPGNVLVGPGADSVKLTDFGLAHAVDREGVTLTSAAAGIGGTPAYMATEQFVGDPRDVGPWSDLYALGCLVHSLLNGVPPFGRKPWLKVANGHIHKAPPRLTPQISLPRGFEPWVLRLLEKDAAKRYQRASDAAWDLCELDDPTELMVRNKGGVIDPDEGPFGAAHITQTTLQWGDVFADRKQSPPPAERFRLIPEQKAPPMPVNWRGPERPFREAFGTGLFEMRVLPLVGREREREALWGALREVRESGETGVIVLEGPAGWGKSRLAEWLVTRSLELGAASVLRAVHSPMATPAAGLGPMVERWVRAVGLKREAARMRVEIALELISTTPELIDPLTELVHPIGAAARASGMGGVQLGKVSERHTLIRDLLKAIASDRPVVLWLDDVQWGLDSLEFVQHLLQATPALPILLVLTVRSESLHRSSPEAHVLREVGAHVRARKVMVGPLHERDRRILLRDGLRLGPDLAATVDSRTGGNPQFAIQLVSAWVRQGALRSVRGGWALKPGVQVQIPDNLHGVWSQAIEALLVTRTEDDALALELAAALGRQVDVKEWQAVCVRAKVTPEAGLIEALLSRQIIQSSHPEREWAFLHGMVHESVIRRAQEGGRWKKANRACAAFLVNSPKHVDPARLARHLAAAGDDSAALTPMRASISERVSAGQYREAETLLAELDAMLGRLGHDDDAPAMGWSHILRARMARLRRDFAGAAVSAVAGERAARAGNDPRALLDALLERGRLEIRGGAPGQARDRLAEASMLARTLGDPLRIAEVDRDLGFAFSRLGQVARARELFMRAVGIYRRQKREDLAGEVWMGLAEIGRSSGRNDLAHKWAEEALRCFTLQGSRWGMAAALNTVADLRRLSGDLDGAEAQFRQVLEQYQQLGIAEGAMARLNLALVLLARERWREARSELQRFKAAAASGYPLARAAVHAGLAACAAHGKDWTDVQRNLLQVKAAMEQAVIYDVDLANLLQLTGTLAAVAGRRRHARQALELTLAQWRALGRDAQAAAIEEALRSL